jgi:hypothetical protein
MPALKRLSLSRVQQAAGEWRANASQTVKFRLTGVIDL